MTARVQLDMATYKGAMASLDQAWTVADDGLAHVAERTASPLVRLLHEQMGSSNSSLPDCQPDPGRVIFLSLCFVELQAVAVAVAVAADADADADADATAGSHRAAARAILRAANLEPPDMARLRPPFREALDRLAHLAEHSAGAVSELLLQQMEAAELWLLDGWCAAVVGDE